MRKVKTGPPEKSELRRRAEDRVSANEAATSPSASGADSQKLLQELQIHQIELEMQNEELRRVQSVLKTEQARYFDLYELAPVGYLTLSETGLILESNLTAAGQLGVVKSALLKQRFSRLIFHDDQDTFYRHHKQLFATKEPQACEVRMLRANAAPFWVQLETTTMSDAQNETTCRLVMIDVTERKRIEEELRSSEARFRAFYDLGLVGLAITSPEKGWIKINDCLCDMLGYKEDELRQMTWVQITHPDDLAADNEQFGRVLVGEIDGYELEKRFISRSSGIIFTKLVVRCVRKPDHSVDYMVAMVEDITDRRQAEEALQEADDLLKTAVTQSPSGILIAHAPDVTIRMANPAALGIRGGDAGLLTGIDVTKHAVNWLTFRPDGSPCPPEQLPLSRAVLKGEVTQNEEVIIRDEAGNDHWVSANAAPVYNEQGNITAGIVIFHDITERKLAIERVQKSEEKFNKAFHSSPVLTAISTIEDGRFLDVNEIFLQALSFSREEVIGKTSIELGLFANPAQRQGARTMIEEQGYARNIEAQMVTKNGKIIDGLFSAEPITINNEKCWLTVMVDVTEQKRVEAALRESESRFRLIMDTIEEVFWMADTGIENNFFTSPSYEHVWGRTLQSLKEDPQSFITAAHPDDRARVMSVLEIQKTGQPFEHEYRIIRPDGSIRWIWDRGFPIEDDEGHVSRYVGVATDITARKQAEDTLQRSEERNRTILQTALDGFWVVDMQGRLVEVNESYCRMSGYNEQELLAMSIADIEAIETEDNTAAHICKVIELGQDRFESKHRRKDGSIVDVEISVQHRADNGGQNIAFLRDITERKRAEEKLVAGHKLLSNLASLVPGVIYQYRLYPDGRSAFPYASQAMNDIYEVTPEEVREDATPVFGRLHPDDHDRVAADIFESARTLETFYCEFRVILPRQGLRWRWSQAQPQRLDDGSTLWHGIISDITDRKQAEEQFNEITRRLHLATASAKAGVWDWNLQTNEMIWDNRMHELYGLTHENFPGGIKAWEQVLHPDDAARAIEECQAALRGKRDFDTEFRVRRPDGTVIHIKANGLVLRDEGGVPLRMIGLNTDITERKCAEEALRESEERYQSLLEQAGDGIFILDTTGKILSVNKSFADMHGTTVDEVLRMGLEELDVEGVTPVPDRIRRIMRGETLSFEVEHYHTDGHTFPLAVTANLVSTGDEKMIIAIHHDLSYRKQVEEEKRELLDRLQRAEKMEALGQLAGGVAHDLNNVLGILSGYSELLLDEIPEGSKSRGHVEKIMKSTKKGAAIIDDLLTLARRGVTATDVVNLNSIVSDFMTTPSFENIKDYNSGVTFRTECEESLPNIKGSSIHLEKTLMNLVSNAAEAISGLGAVTIRTEGCYLEKPIKGYDEIKEGEYTVLTVSDTGAGIPADSLGKIFEPFYTKKKMGRSGTGLGLSIVWGTVKDHEGYVDIQTEEGKGTTFSLYFPVTEEKLTEPKEDVPIERYMGKGETVLVVDDRAGQREIASQLIAKLGYQVHLASSGEAAVEYLKTQKADIIVLDMIMPPGMDGLDTYKKILEINPKQKAIIVSGFSESDRVKEARAIGAGAYLKKPYVKEKLGVAVRKELDRK